MSKGLAIEEARYSPVRCQLGAGGQKQLPLGSLLRRGRPFPGVHYRGTMLA